MRQEWVNIRKGERYRNGKLTPPPKPKLGAHNSVSQIESITPNPCKAGFKCRIGTTALAEIRHYQKEFQVSDGHSSLRQVSMGDP